MSSSFFVCAAPIIIVLLTGCGQKDPQSEPPTISPTESAGQNSGVTHNEPPAIGSCDTLRSDFRTQLASAERKCKQASDCGCYPAVIDCGGVVDRASADHFESIAEQFRASSCEFVNKNGNTFNCAPRACNPQCIDGRCL